MKKTYIEPSVMVAYIGTTAMICGSQDITSDKGIDYGGVDEDGDEICCSFVGGFLKG